ncbi:hypothetical protein H0H93_007019 [Arthromyces matolae]|nr:hypothetical protein H0H93_007019 [Arthromyces matolae]
MSFTHKLNTSSKRPVYPSLSKPQVELPPELIGLIIDNVPDRSTLRKCRLAHRSFDQQCAKRLFFRVVIKRDERQAWQLYRFAMGRQSIANSIRAVEVIRNRSFLERSSDYTGYIAFLIRDLPRITSIRFSRYSLDIWQPTLVKVLLEVLSVKRLSEVSFCSTSVPVEILQGCASVPCLTLESSWVSVSEAYSQKSKPVQQTPSSIRHLCLYSATHDFYMNDERFRLNMSSVHTLEVYALGLGRQDKPLTSAKLSTLLTFFSSNLSLIVCQCPFLGGADAFDFGQLSGLQSLELVCRVEEAHDWVAEVLEKTVTSVSIQEFVVVIRDDLSQRRAMDSCISALKKVDQVLDASLLRFPSLITLRVRYITPSPRYTDTIASFLRKEERLQGVTGENYVDRHACRTLIDTELSNFHETHMDMRNSILTALPNLVQTDKFKLTLEASSSQTI